MRSVTPWVHKGRVLDQVYIDKAVKARVPSGLFKSVFDAPRVHGGTRKSKDSPPLPTPLQVKADPKQQRQRARKRRILERIINPTPTFRTIGAFKVY